MLALKKFVWVLNLTLLLGAWITHSSGTDSVSVECSLVEPSLGFVSPETVGDIWLLDGVFGNVSRWCDRLGSIQSLRGTGTIFLRIFLFRSVNPLLPSTLTWYCLFRNAWTITPVFVHFLGWCPSWFWIWTASLLCRGGSGPLLLSALFIARFARPWALHFDISSHSWRSFLANRGRWSLRFLPNSSSASETPVP